MSTVGRWHRWLRWIRWIRVNHSQPSAFIAARSVARYPTRRAATYRLKACRPVPCPPFETAWLEVHQISCPLPLFADTERFMARHFPRIKPPEIP